VLGAAARRGELSFWVQDDGCGTPPADARRGGLGLTSMRRRARRIGAVLAVASPPSAEEPGTRVSVTVGARPQRGIASFS
jgi:signal transduction histidine kinase